jgi:hypothetical protein
VLQRFVSSRLILSVSATSSSAKTAVLISTNWLITIYTLLYFYFFFSYIMKNTKRKLKIGKERLALKFSVAIGSCSYKISYPTRNNHKPF